MLHANSLRENLVQMSSSPVMTFVQYFGLIIMKEDLESGDLKVYSSIGGFFSIKNNNKIYEIKFIKTK